MKKNPAAVKVIMSLALLLFALPAVSQNFYWENPVRISTGDARFPHVAANDSDTYVFWQEVDARAGWIWLSCQYRDERGAWQTNSRFAGPFPYSGEVPDIYSAAVAANGTIAVAALSNIAELSVFVSRDGAKSFSQTVLTGEDEPFVAPRIYATRTNSFFLFVSFGEDESFHMHFATSKDGMRWGAFADFAGVRGLQNPFIPVLASTAEGEHVVFQAQYITGNRISYQLYETISTDGGRTWSSPLLLTDSNALSSGDTRDFALYHNQRPVMSVIAGELYIAWERTYYASESAHICVAKLSRSGIVPGSIEQITADGNASRPVLFSFNDMISTVWFDTRSGVEAVYMAQKSGVLWNEMLLSSGRRNSLFAFPVIVRNSSGAKYLSFIWQESQSIFRLSPDISVEPPRITPLSHIAGRRATAEKVRYRITLPEDSSGIAGFSWSWATDEHAVPPKYIMNLPAQRTIEVAAESEGAWHLKVSALDYAGNWSAPAAIEYYLDLTPPNQPIVALPKTDAFGFLESNSFGVQWSSDASDDDVAGYTWNLQYLAPIDSRVAENKRHPIRMRDEDVRSFVSSFMAAHANDVYAVDLPPRRIMGTGTTASFLNRNNGLYAFSVAAVDTVGNIGKPSSVLLLLNKYVPETYIRSVSSDSDIFGNITLDIVGGGFTYDGTVETIYIDADGTPPYAMTLRRTDGAFQVISDNRIANVKLGNSLPEGVYRLVVVHPDRGLYTSAPLLRIAENGTVKIERQYTYVPSWMPVQNTLNYHIQIGTLLLWIVCALATVGFIFAALGLVQAARDAVAVRLEIQALITGDVMPFEKKKKAVHLKQKGVSLRLKLMGFTIILVVCIVSIVAVPLGINMVRTQEETLARGLSERIDMLLESLTGSTRIYMPTQNILEMNYLPEQKSALAEAEYVTITGYPADNRNTSLAYVWATNDSGISQKIANSPLTYGVSALTDDTVLEIVSRCAELNDVAVQAAGDIASDIVALNAEGIALALRTDSQSVARRQEIAAVATQLSNKLNTTMNELSAGARSSVPEYNNVRLDRTNTEYLFYRPVLYRQGSSHEYVRGIVFVKVSTQNLINSVDDAMRRIAAIAALIALFAIAIGSIGSFVLASIIVAPIRKLAEHVRVIGATVDKTRLVGKDIEIKRRDEIGQLGESVNEMTHGLVRAAQDEKLLLDGKVVQQTFLPLQTSSDGVKQTIAHLDESSVQCFGYYEGASGVSGDYFDYKKLDDRWYVIIKCDASGHGVPAALLMTVVATLFRKYFDSWSYEKNGTHLNELIAQINDFIESLGIKGKFAAIIICLFDTATGDVYMCNAGDNIVHIYDSVSHKEKTLTLVQTPAAGPLPSFMVEMRGGFKVEKTTLQHGDVLFLYTDGIEEATRKFRDASFNVVKCEAHGLHEGDAHVNHKVGEESEQLEADRVRAIIESVFERKKYTLEKYHNPMPAETLEFDFTTCTGTIEEVILALVSVEKVFRMYKPEDATEADSVRVDKRIDAFLQNHFNKYAYYCGTKRESAESENYFEYTFLREDEQLDDLTLLAVRRP